jgi:PAS domain S-box-containing protein/diguanylate cyclase (GGDEF)-like protein
VLSSQPAAVYLESLFRNAFYEAQIATAVVDAQGRILAGNGAFCRLVGRDEPALQRLSINEFTHPDDWEMTTQGRRQLAAGERRTLRLTKRYVRPDGDVVWVRVEGTRVEDVTGRLLYLIAHVEDLTQARVVEAAHARQEQLLETVHEVARVASEAEHLGTVVQVTIDRLCAVTGWSAGRLLAAVPGTQGPWTAGEWFGATVGASTAQAVAALSNPPSAAAYQGLTRHPLAPEQAGGRPGGDELVSLPVLARNGVVGHLQFLGDPTRAVPVDERALLSIAAQLGHAMAREQDAAMLRASQEQARAVVEQGHDAFIEFDQAGCVTQWNRQAERTFGWSAAEARGRRLADLIIPAELHGTFSAVVKQLIQGPSLGIDGPRRMVQRRDGHRFTVELATSFRQDAGGWRLSAFVRDVSEVLEAQAEAARQRLFLDATLESLTEGVAACDPRGQIILMNGALQRKLGLSGRLDGQSSQRLEDLVLSHPDGAPLPLSQAPLSRALQGQVVESQALTVTQAGGNRTRFVASARPLYDESGACLGAVATFHDVTESTAVADLAEHSSRHDAMTGLLNASGLRDELDRPGADSTFRGLLLVRVHDVRAVTTGRGEPEGEKLVQEIIHRLRDSLRDDATLARSDLDEFAVISRGNQPESLLPVAQRLMAALERPDEAVNATRFSVSIGAAGTVDGSTSDLLHEARVALAAAVAAGPGRLVMYREGMKDVLCQRLALQADLQRALDEQEFELRYQPQVDVSTGQIVGVEALVRWQHPTRGLVRPDEFIGLAEQTGLIVPLGKWVLDTACAQLARWHAAGYGHLVMAVNVSAVQLDGRFVDDVTQALRDSGVPAQRLDLELTETAAVEQASACVAVLRQLADLGVALSIDDFGTGYSMLGQLRQLPFVRLKIDRSFVKECDEQAGAPLVVAMMAMARGLGLDVVAEGVETPAQLAFLRAQGCQFAQGYLFARPVDAAQLVGLLGQNEPLPGFPAPDVPHVPGTDLRPVDPAGIDQLARPLLEHLRRMTGLESTYLTHVADGRQDILVASNTGDLQITEGLQVSWSDSLCSRAITDGPVFLRDARETFPTCSAATDLGIRSYLGVPILDDDGKLVGTLCAASASVVEVDRHTLDTVAFYAQILGERISHKRLAEAEQERHRSVQRHQHAQAMVLATAEARLREPLNTLSISSDRLAASWTALPEVQIRQALLALADSTAQVRRHLDQLLDQARGEILRHAVNLEPLLLQPQLAASLQASGLSTTNAVTLSGQDDVRVLTDRVALQQAVAAVLDLTSRRCAAGTAVSIDVECIGDGVAVQVRDAGPAWPATADLFAPLPAGRVGTLETTDLTGALFLARTLIEATGGTIDARAQRSGACVVTLWLPRSGA